MKSKNLVAILVVVLLIIVVVYVVAIKQKKPVTNNTPPPADQQQPQSYSPNIIPNSELPKGLPSSLPLEQGATVLQNFDLKDPATGKTQSTRIYVSKKTVDENWAVYQKYAADNGFAITSMVDQPAIKSFDAEKSGARLNVIIAKDSKGQVTVSVNYIE